MDRVSLFEFVVCMLLVLALPVFMVICAFNAPNDDMAKLFGVLSFLTGIGSFVFVGLCVMDRL